jgi:hypothetical protein
MFVEGKGKRKRLELGKDRTMEEVTTKPQSTRMAKTERNPSTHLIAYILRP